MAAAVVVGGADGNIVVAGPAHSSLAGNMELQVSRRRVKFLATILLLISVLNLVTLVRFQCRSLSFVGGGLKGDFV